MLLKNNTGKIIGISMKSILPGETAECPEGYENNPVVKRYINNGTFEVIAGESPVLKEEKSIPDPAASANEKELEEMTEDELIKYAVEHGIELGRATTREGVLKKIQDAM